MGTKISGRDELDLALQQLEVQALNFGFEFIKNDAVRSSYLREIQTMSRDVKTAYERGVMTAKEGAELANQLRNDILTKSRARQTRLGRAYSESLKKEGKVLGDLLEHYSGKRYERAFNQLDATQQEKVFIEIIESAGRDRAATTNLAKSLRWGGRICWIFTAGVALYNIGASENKAWATGREATNLGGGFAGGAAGGAVAGIWFGPIGIAAGAVIGGVLGALVADEAYLEIAGTEREHVNSIVDPNTTMFYTDEEGMADDLIFKSGISLGDVYQTFLELDQNYSSDADDIAYLYVKKVREQRGSLEQGLRLNTRLRNLLIRLLDEGWTADDEYGTIRYLEGLAY